MQQKYNNAYYVGINGMKYNLSIISLKIRVEQSYIENE